MINGSRILVVDDTRDPLQFFFTTLKQAGYDVLPVATAADCLGIAQERRPDLVLLDVLIAEQTSMELCRLIKSEAGSATLLVRDRALKLSGENGTSALENAQTGILLSRWNHRHCYPR
jgi:DNA-binding response OmpR family regulator